MAAGRQTLRAESFAYLTRCLDWCAKHNLRAVVDLHILKAHHFNVENEGGKITLWTDPAAQDNFIKLWVEISGRLKKYPVDRVAYELMNEPVAAGPGRLEQADRESGESHPPA